MLSPNIVFVTISLGPDSDSTREPPCAGSPSYTLNVAPAGIINLVPAAIS